MRPNQYTIVIKPAEGRFELAQAGVLLREYLEHLRPLLPPGSLEHRAGELAGVPATLLPPLATLWLAWSGSHSVGCVALRRTVLYNGEQISELCRLFVQPAACGRSVASALLKAAINAARARGDRAVVLNTVEVVMQDARRLYLREGFRPTTPYKPAPLAGTCFYRLDLEGRLAPTENNSNR